MSKIQKMIEVACAIADDNKHGYSQTSRWGSPDFDCSSLAIYCAHMAGYAVNTGIGSSRNIDSLLTKAGFLKLAYDGVVNDLSPGDIIVRSGQGPDGSYQGHVAICVGKNKWVEASGDYDGKPGDSSGKEIHYTKPYHYGKFPYDWDYVLIPPDDGISNSAQDDIKDLITGIIENAQKLKSLLK